LRPTLLNLETNDELRADAVLDQVGLRQGLDWRHPPGRGGKAGPAGFVRAGPQQLTLTLGFDGERLGAPPTDVRAKLHHLDAMTAPNPKTGRPPRVLFTWGEYSLPVVVDAVEVQYGRCVREGFPTRAVVTLRATESRHDPAAGPDRSLVKVPVAALTATAGAVAVAAGGAAAAIATARKAAERAVGEVNERAREVRDATEAAFNDLKAKVQPQVEAVEAEVKKAEAAIKESERAVKKTFADLTNLPGEAKQKIDAAAEVVSKSVKSLYSQVTAATAALEEMTRDKIRGAKQLGDRVSG
jgi:hypothetical protein